MPTVQDTYNSAPATGFPGQVANGETSNRISRTVEDAAGIAFGAPVWAGSDARGCTATPGTAANFLGFAIAEHGQPLLPGGVAADRIPQYRSIGILTLGAIYVTATGAVAKRAAVTVGAGADAAHGIDDIAADATHIAATGWIFDEAASAGAIVRVARR